ncbi:conjugative transposon protein TraF [Prevotella intermedia ZT]|uniref:Conjugative transposon protein TraF n=1 Tax=Prevotella intermedia ZT TaxID=1347790 RepID=A0AAP0V7L7_PREIN|nr:conjugative transposon protein TraF [Prevotella intermedia ZT]
MPFSCCLSSSIWRVSINGSVSASEGLPHPFWCGRLSP